MRKRLFKVQKREDWTISWGENKLRWVILYYLVGIIVSCIVTFFEEAFSPVRMPYLAKSLIILAGIPACTVLMSIYIASRRPSA